MTSDNEEEEEEEETDDDDDDDEELYCHVIFRRSLNGMIRTQIHLLRLCEVLAAGNVS